MARGRGSSSDPLPIAAADCGGAAPWAADVAEARPLRRHRMRPSRRQPRCTARRVCRAASRPAAPLISASARPTSARRRAGSHPSRRCRPCVGGQVALDHRRCPKSEEERRRARPRGARRRRGRSAMAHRPRSRARHRGGRSDSRSRVRSVARPPRLEFFGENSRAAASAAASGGGAATSSPAWADLSDLWRATPPAAGTGSTGTPLGAASPRRALPPGDLIIGRCSPTSSICGWSLPLPRRRALAFSINSRAAGKLRQPPRRRCPAGRNPRACPAPRTDVSRARRSAPPASSASASTAEPQRRRRRPPPNAAPDRGAGGARRPLGTSEAGEVRHAAPWRATRRCRGPQGRPRSGTAGAVSRSAHARDGRPRTYPRSSASTYCTTGDGTGHDALSLLNARSSSSRNGVTPTAVSGSTAPVAGRGRGTPTSAVMLAPRAGARNQFRHRTLPRLL